MGVQQRCQPVGGSHLGFHVVVTQPGQRTQALRRWRQLMDDPEAVAVGAQVVGQAVAVLRIGLGPGGTPAGPGGVERVGVDRHHRMACCQQPLHDQAARPLDRHRQLCGLSVAGKPLQAPGDPILGVLHLEGIDQPAGIVDDAHVVGLAGPIPTNLHPCFSLRSARHDKLHGAESPPRTLTVRPSVGRVPKAGYGLSARRGRRYSRWPSKGSRAWPSPNVHRDAGETLQASDLQASDFSLARMVHQ